MKVSLLLLVMMFLHAMLPAQQAEEALTKLKGDLEFKAERLRQPMMEFQEKYQGQLKALRDKAQAAGDLNLIVAIDKEIQLAPRGGSKIPDGLTQLVRLRGIYDKHAATLEKERQTKYLALLPGYRENLMKLQAQLTKAGQIEEALIVKRTIETLDGEIAAGRVPEAGGPGLGDAIPGVLVVGGKYSDGSPVTLSQEQKDQQFIRVAAGADHWMALGADGKVYPRLGSREEFKPDPKIDDFVDIHCGRHLMMAVRRDGTIVALGREENTATVPEYEKGQVAKISLGHSRNLWLLKDGTLQVFGYSYEPRGNAFPRTDLLRDVLDAEHAAENLIVLKKDGTLELVTPSGEAVPDRPEGLKTDEIVAMEGGFSYGSLILDKDGKIHPWHISAPPEGLGKAKQLRVGLALLGAQMEDGSWRVWDGGNTPPVQALNAQLKELGPLKDLALGGTYFIGIR